MLHFRLLIAAASLQAIAVLPATAKDENPEQHLVRTLTGHKGYVRSVAFSPDGHFALSDGEGYGWWSYSDREDPTVKLWDVAAGKEIRTFAVHAEAAEVVTVWGWDRGKVTGTKVSAVRPDVATVGTFSPDGRFALSISCRRYETKAGKLYIESGGGSYEAKCIEYSLTLWEVATGRELRSFTGHTDEVKSVSFSPDGRLALLGSSGKTGKLWDVTAGKEIKTFTGHEASVSSVAFPPDGRFALSGSKDETMKTLGCDHGSRD